MRGILSLLNHERLKHLAIRLVMFAVILQGAIPLGWMPAAAGTDGYIVICTGNGPVGVYLDADGNPLPDAPGSAVDHSKPCDFAAAAQISAPVETVGAIAPTEQTTDTLLPAVRFALNPSPYSFARSRAPPAAA